MPRVSRVLLISTLHSRVSDRYRKTDIYLIDRKEVITDLFSTYIAIGLIQLTPLVLKCMGQRQLVKPSHGQTHAILIICNRQMICFYELWHLDTQQWWSHWRNLSMIGLKKLRVKNTEYILSAGTRIILVPMFSSILPLVIVGTTLIY